MGVEKTVPKIEYQIRESVVEVPIVVREERIIEVPQVEIVEVLKQVEVPITQTVDKQCLNTVTSFFEKTVEIPHLLTEEEAVEVPQVSIVEATTERAHVQYTGRAKQVPKVHLQVQ